MLERLNNLNSDIKIYSIFDDEFKSFGRVINDIDVTELIDTANKINLPEEGSLYTASEPSFECLDFAKIVENNIFGETPTQIGYCYGHSNFLNATEWHTSSEVNVAVTDLVLILAERKDLVDYKIDSSKFKAFFVEKGTVIEVYATSLHFCPCETTSTGFGCVVCLPKGTNTDLENSYDDKLLFRKNKWIICHEGNTALINRGVVPGISGINYEIKY